MSNEESKQIYLGISWEKLQGKIESLKDVRIDVLHQLCKGQRLEGLFGLSDIISTNIEEGKVIFL